MLHILLLILKIIGGLILAVLALAVLLMAVVLLVPVRYRISAMKYTSAVIEANVSWLCHLIGFFFRLDTAKEEEHRIHLRLRIAGFCFYDNFKPKEKRIKKVRPRKTKQHRESESEAASEKLPEAEKVSAASEPGRKSADRKIPEKEKKQTAEKASKPKKVSEKSKKSGGGIRQKLQNLAEKLENLKNKKDKLMAIYHDEQNHRWLVSFFGRLKRMLFGLLPKIDRLLWHFGFNDPASTGKVLGMLSVLYPVCKDRMVLQPEFEREVMEGEVRLHGKIRLLPIAAFAVHSFLNRRFFAIIKQIKNI